MALNTLYSLYAHKLADPGALAAAERLLFMPDLFHFWLSGNLNVEATIASTSQMVDCHTGDWARDMLGELGLPTRILGADLAAGHDRGDDSPCPGDGHWFAGRIEGDRAGGARHGERGGGRAGGRGNELVLPVERHVVAVGGGAAGAVRIERGAGGDVHQRVGRVRHDTVFEEHSRVCGWCRNRGATWRGRGRSSITRS